MVQWLIAQKCPTLCDPMDHSPPGSSVHGILQARILEWVAISSPGDLADLGIKLRSPTLQADSLPSEPPVKVTSWASQVAPVIKNPPANAGDTRDTGLISV